MYNLLTVVLFSLFLFFFLQLRLAKVLIASNFLIQLGGFVWKSRFSDDRLITDVLRRLLNIMQSWRMVKRSSMVENRKIVCKLN